MIIKKRKSRSPGTSAKTEAFAAAPEPVSPVNKEPLWTEENIEAGIVPERRKDYKDDRRRGYRRIEEKHLISKAYEEANAIRENAYREGFEQGMQDARQEIGQLRETFGNLLHGHQEALASLVDEIAPLAVEVAERIIKTEVSCDSSLVMSLVRDTIQKAGRSNKTILVKVHPEDVPMVKHSLKEEPIPNLSAELIVMEDATVDPGSCIVETNSGLIDASFSTQLGVLQQLFGGRPDREEATGEFFD